MGWTSPWIAKNAVVAAAHQTAFGTGASSGGTLVRGQCAEAAVYREQVAIDPQGTTGSEYPRDTRVEIAVKPRAMLRFYVAYRPFLALILEHATHGQPVATLANSDLTESGDTAAVLSAWSLTGVRPTFNSDASYILYAKLEDEQPGAGQARVSLYSDSARTALVAQGSAANGASCTLAAQNNSGLSGTVTLGTVAADNLTGITLTISRVRPQRAALISRYFTLFVESGGALVTMTGCTVSRLVFRSSENGPLICEAEIVGGTYTKGATTLSPTALTLEPFSHAIAAFTYNSTTYSALEIAHGIEHEVERDIANSATPATIWKRGSVCLPIEVKMRPSDESIAIRDDGAAANWRQVTVVYTYGSKALSFTYPRTQAIEPEIPPFRDDRYDDHALTLEARDDGTNDPVTITLQV